MRRTGSFLGFRRVAVVTKSQHGHTWDEGLSAPPELGRPLLDERPHALSLVIGAEQGDEELLLPGDARGAGGPHGRLDGLLRGGEGHPGTLGERTRLLHGHLEYLVRGD